ncbi:NADH-dependent phenylglyoxylate dehydrogenase subunit gamma [Magnetospirillum sp. SS-4]|uniref:NADH-dependent phenylglyoxylate dehydrogenase subunit gamma n=1 Tax=Magnetospirillum sp. SS-4 TaxID=2681465 RepID=UPI0013840F15|nr:2-oxoacid:acceptor oxidoreductase family protein [Magnetospirillum sp. SS-4]CAA7626249.1 NADH-dependent phenylglyoxylate dehydrogenase subunit gamma [Magnetospirillum sp. SS-4]
MHEVRLHGRGGQGAVLASAILAAALVEEGQHVMAIPAFGFERRGAPVVAFLRMSDQVIRRITNIYSPDIVVVIDPTVARAVDVFAGMPANGTYILATNRQPGELELPSHLGRVAVCDATHIAMDIFKRQITNTIMLGAFAKATGLVSVAALETALEETDFRDAGLRQNIEAVRRGYAETTVVNLGKEKAA